MMWFDELTGFSEQDVLNVADEFEIDGDHLTSHHNGRRMCSGRFENPSLAELQEQMPAANGRPTTVREIVADVQALHRDSANAGALFQVASQFNTLEMASPSVTPEAGVSGYEYDHTQGPACAIACGAGTIWRNYFADVDGERGQTADRQIDNLADLVSNAGVTVTMRNGYALPTDQQLRTLVTHIDSLDADQRNILGSLLRVGIQWNAEVTLGGAGHTVTQAYCSGVPIAYSSQTNEAWESLARLILDATYDATLTAGRTNAQATGNSTVYLTLIGGGVFGNPAAWIVSAIERAIERHANSGLDVVIVSYGGPNAKLSGLVDQKDVAGA